MKQFLITTTIILAMVAHSVVIADPLEREQLIKECMENLDVIGKAIAAYRADHQGEMPDWLSDLYPKYLQDPQILLCPADETKGLPALHTAYKDPNMPCSYIYEFNPMKSVKVSLFDIKPPKDLTYKRAKTMQLKYFGNMLLVVRCWHHGMQTLNLGYDGKVYFSARDWEYRPEAAKAVLSFFQSVIEDNPDGWEKEFSLKEMHSYFGRSGRLPDFRVLLEKQKNLSADALKVLAEIYQSEGKIDETIEIYHRLVRLVPNDVDARFQLAKLYSKAKKYQAARGQCQRIIQLGPDNSKVYALLVELDAIRDGRRIQKGFSEIPAEDPEMHYLVKLEEILFSSRKELKPTIKKARGILRESFGESTSVARLRHLYKTLDKSLVGRSEQWKTYTTSDGLINDYVWAVAQDSRGILWIGTAKGVCQYDGESFTSFTINEELREASISSILIDNQEHIWFGTRSHGVVRYGGEDFVNYTVEDGLAGNQVNEIFQDRNGSVWFVCRLGGISRYDGKTFTNFTTEDGLAHNDLYTITEDSRGVLWIGTQDGVSKYDGKTFTNLAKADGLVGNHVYAIAEYRDGNLWFGTNKGVSRYDGEQFTSFTTKEGLIGNNISDIWEDREGNLWFAAWGGVSYYDGGAFINFTTQDGLAGNYINCVFEDREGNLWFGHGAADGLSRSNPHGLRNYGIQDGLPGTAVYSIAEDHRGNLWIAAGGGVAKYDGTTFTQPIVESRRTLGNVRVILADSKHNLWFGTYNRGLIRYDGKNYTRFTTLDGLVGHII